MDNQHFILATRYLAIMEDGTEEKIDLCPENCYYFREQEKLYLIRAIRRQELDINKVIRIQSYFIPVETEEPVKISIGV